MPHEIPKLGDFEGSHLVAGEFLQRHGNPSLARLAGDSSPRSQFLLPPNGPEAS